MFLADSVVLSLAALSSARAASDTVCPKGWMANEGRCYLFGKQSVHFTGAESFCRVQNAHLVEISNIHENSFIKDRLRDFKAKNWWLGITDEAVEGEWKNFNTDSYISFADWAPGQPDTTKDEDCAVLVSSLDYRWGDVSCIFLASPICEMSGNRCKQEVVVTVGPTQRSLD